MLRGEGGGRRRLDGERRLRRCRGAAAAERYPLPTASRPVGERAAGAKRCAGSPPRPPLITAPECTQPVASTRGQRAGRRHFGGVEQSGRTRAEGATNCGGAWAAAAGRQGEYLAALLNQRQ